ncbi:GntR family transcriptional regulator [Salinispira pacifica]
MRSGSLEGRIPRYLRVYNLIKGRIESGEFEVGHFLPAEPELERLFSVSRTTVRKAVEMLAQEGFVYIKQGKGTKVLDFRATQHLQYITSFSETLREKGLSVTHTRLTVVRCVPPESVADQLGLDSAAQVVRVSRVTHAGGKPIALITNYLLPELFPGIESKIAAMSSLYAFLESEYDVTIEAATDYITARGATEEEAGLLHIGEGQPLLVVRRVTHSGGRPIEVAVLQIDAERYEYCVHTKDRPPRTLF